jgi:hypothetical protein
MLIQISAHIQSKSGGYLLLLDHGEGMNQDQLINFATFARSRLDRGETPLIHGQKVDRSSTFIGKFGVGAKQGGFYLGDRIRILTRSMTAKKCSKDQQSWLDFCLDAKEMRERVQQQLPVFEGNVTEFTHIEDVLPREEMQYNQGSLLQELLQWMTQHDHGTIFIIKLKDSRIPSFENEKMIEKFNQELSDIHYFYLHPEHRTNVSLEHRAKKELRHEPIKRHPFTIITKLVKDGRDKGQFNLKDTKCFGYKCFNEEASLKFHFGFQIKTVIMICCN